MKKLALIGVAAIALAGCATVSSDKSDLIRQQFAAQIAAFNAAGVDPLQVLDDPEKRLMATVACGALSSIGSVVDPTAPTLTGEIGDWCAELVRALSPAAPVAAPLPAAKPAG